MAWDKRPTEFMAEVEAELNKRLRASAMQALSGVIERSPVDSGHYRGNHHVSVMQPSNEYDLMAEDDSGALTLAEGSAVISRVKDPYGIIYIQNATPYAGVIESGGFIYKPGGKTTPDGYSIQAPYGVYTVTFQALNEASR